MILQSNELKRCSSRLTYKVCDAVRITNIFYFNKKYGHEAGEALPGEITIYFSLCSSISTLVSPFSAYHHPETATLEVTVGSNP